MNSPTETTPVQGIRSSRSSRCARACMLCGAALIAWSILAPAGALVWSALQKRSQSTTPQNTTSATAAPVVIAPSGPLIAAPRQDPVTGTTASTVAQESSVITKLLPHSAAVKQRVLTKATSAPNSRSAAEEKARREVMTVYRDWKASWYARDVNRIMKFYSPRVRFHASGQRNMDYVTLRPWFEALWAEGSYTVRDIGEPHLSIRGDHAVLIAGQNYARRHGERFSRARLTNRFFLKREVYKGNGTVTSSSTRRWRIIEEDYLPFQGNTDINVQIY
jgi:hypothetical protein